MMRQVFILSLLIFSLKSYAQTTVHPDSSKVTFLCVDQELVVEDSVQIQLFDPSGKEIINVFADIYGRASFMVKRGVQYSMKTSKYGSTKDQAPLLCDKAKENVRLKIKFYEKKYKEKWELAVYFKTDEHTLDFEDLAALKSLYDILIEKPTMNIEIAAHTDNQGSDKYNMALSQRRANSVRGYLIGKGIAAERIYSKGYGETEPKASNETEEGRAQNRRVEVRVLEL